MMHRRVVCFLLVALAVLVSSRHSHAVVVERVVAVVNDRAILMTDLRARARPHLIEIHAKSTSEAQRAAAESQLLRQMLHRMIDDEIISQEASKRKIRVDGDEVEKSIARLARMQELTVEDLMAEMARAGMTPQEYRAEVRRQLLEGKLLDLRVRGQIRVTEEEMRSLFERLQRDERRSLPYVPQWIVLRIPANATQQERAERRTLAERVAAEARSGKDFASLARQYSDDAATRLQGGSLGMLRPGEADGSIERVAFSLDVGEVSTPFRYADALVVLRVDDRSPSRLGDLEDVRDQLANRVYAEKLESAKRRWLDNLKRGLHIDIRL